MEFSVKQRPVTCNRIGELVVGTFEQKFRRSGSVGWLGVDVPVASAIGTENDARAVAAPQRHIIGGVWSRQPTPGPALQIVNPNLHTLPDDCLRPVRRKARLPIHILALAQQ